MTDKEYEYVLNESFKRIGITKQMFFDNIETGVKNGYTVKQQLDKLKLILNVN